MLISSSAMADVQIQLPREVKVLAVNCAEKSVVQKLTLPDGDNQIALRLITEFGKAGDEEMAYSDVFVVRFSADQGMYTLQIPKISRPYDITRFNTEPKISITDAANHQLTVNVAELTKEGYQLVRNYAEELEGFNRTDSPAAFACPAVSESSKKKTEVKSKEVKETPELAVKEKKTAKQPTDSENVSTAETMLYYWYDQADEETKKRFKESIK